MQLKSIMNIYLEFHFDKRNKDLIFKIRPIQKINLGNCENPQTASIGFYCKTIFYNARNLL